MFAIILTRTLRRWRLRLAGSRSILWLMKACIMPVPILCFAEEPFLVMALPKGSNWKIIISHPYRKGSMPSWEIMKKKDTNWAFPCAPGITKWRPRNLSAHPYLRKSTWPLITTLYWWMWWAAWQAVINWECCFMKNHLQTSMEVVSITIGAWPLTPE